MRLWLLVVLTVSGITAFSSPVFSQTQPTQACAPLLAGGIRDETSLQMRVAQEDGVFDYLEKQASSTHGSSTEGNFGFMGLSAGASDERTSAEVQQFKKGGFSRAYLRAAYSEEIRATNLGLIAGFNECIRNTASGVVLWIQPSGDSNSDREFIVMIRNTIGSHVANKISQFDLGDLVDCHQPKGTRWASPTVWQNQSLFTNLDTKIRCRNRSNKSVRIIATSSFGNIDGVPSVPPPAGFSPAPRVPATLKGTMSELGYMEPRPTKDGRDLYATGQNTNGPQGVSFTLSSKADVRYDLDALIRKKTDKSMCFNVKINNPVNSRDRLLNPTPISRSCSASWNDQYKFQWIRVATNVTLPAKTSYNEATSFSPDGTARVLLIAEGSKAEDYSMPDVMDLRAIEHQ